MLEVGGVVAELERDDAGQDERKRPSWRGRRSTSPDTAASRAGDTDGRHHARLQTLEESVQTIRAEVEALRAELQESRQLNRRVAELTDIVAELIVPLAARDPDAGRDALRQYLGQSEGD